MLAHINYPGRCTNPIAGQGQGPVADCSPKCQGMCAFLWVHIEQARGTYTCWQWWAEPAAGLFAYPVRVQGFLLRGADILSAAAYIRCAAVDQEWCAGGVHRKSCHPPVPVTENTASP